MKIIKEKERGYRSFIEKYDLNGCYAGQKGIPVGVLLLYILIKDSGIRFIEVTAEAESELGEAHNILNESDVRVFADLTVLAGLFQRQRLKIWELTGEYLGEEVHITGRTYGTVLSVRTLLTSKADILPLMNAVELATYDYHNYGEALVDDIKRRFRMDQKMTIRMLFDLEKHRDIYAEFVSGMRNDPFVFPSENAISVEGNTAENLCKNYLLSEFGAYHYLIYLRESPKEALDDLRKGLSKR